MGTLIEAGRYALEGVEVMFAFVTAAILGLGMLTAQRAAQNAAHEPPAAPAALQDGGQDLSHAA
jgi:hypothetical protein